MAELLTKSGSMIATDLLFGTSANLAASPMQAFQSRKSAEATKLLLVPFNAAILASSALSSIAYGILLINAFSSPETSSSTKINSLILLPSTILNILNTNFKLHLTLWMTRNLNLSIIQRLLKLLKLNLLHILLSRHRFHILQLTMQNQIMKNYQSRQSNHGPPHRCLKSRLMEYYQ